MSYMSKPPKKRGPEPERLVIPRDQIGNVLDDLLPKKPAPPRDPKPEPPKPATKKD